MDNRCGAIVRVVVGATLLLAITACEGPTRKPTRSEPKYPVLIVGDSLTTQSPAERSKYMGYAYSEAMYGRAMVQEGFTGPGALAVVPPIVAQLRPKVVVMEIGTNDILGQRPMDEVFADAEQLIAAIPVGTTIVWVALASDQVPERAAAFNTWIRSRIPIVVPWDQWVAANPGHLPDGIHNDAFAADALWKLIGLTMKQKNLRPL